MKNTKLIIPIILLLLLGVAYFFRAEIVDLFSATSKPQKAVSSFEECVNAGNRVGESYPRQCWTQDNKSFVEDVISPVRVAFVGDSGQTDDTEKVLKLITSENSDLLVHLGDFDYKDDPSDWEEELNKSLPANFNIIPVVGNHDVKAWPEYQANIKTRLTNTPEVKCDGEVAVQMTCTFRGLYFVVSGIGTLGEGQEQFVVDNIDNGNYAWRFCVWHKNQKLMQVGSKADEVGWKAYDTCRESAAIIATGHEHSYERTHLMENFETQKIASTNNLLEIAKGKTFAFVSGLGGHSIRDQKDKLAQNPWWAKVYTEDQKASAGVLFCDFYVDNDKNKAKCYFKNVNGEIVDEFELKTVTEGY